MLRRTVQGPRIDEIRQAESKGLSATLDLLLADIPVPPPPLKYQKLDDPYVKFGETWINTNYLASNAYRGTSLMGWYYNNMMQTKYTSVTERMSFFWLNYFGIADVNDHRAMYGYLRLYQEQAMGNLRTMLYRIAVEPAMLQFLDGAVNVKKNPNENFGRELMELFTIGKGNLVGEGDYTTYTEQDVAALARALTGWRNRDYAYAENNTPVESYFDAALHDSGDKKLSHRFGNKVIKNAGDREYKVIIDTILEKKETAANFCRKLYRHFVYYDIDATVERDVIAPLADTLYKSDYEIKPVLRQLLASQHFYEEPVRGAILKNPHDFVCSIVRPFGEYWHESILDDLTWRYELGIRYCNMMDDMNLLFFASPTVAGWKAYYDAPQYYRHWISPALMQRRYAIAKDFAVRFHVDNNRLDFRWYDFVDSMPNKLDVNKFIDDVLLVFLPRPITTEQKDALKEQIMGGLPDMEWTRQCKAYLDNPGQAMYYRPIEDRLRVFFTALFGLAEFQLH